MSIQSSSQTINEAAANWDVRLRSHRCSDSDREAFNQWLQADAQHRAAYERLQRSLSTLRTASDLPQLRAMRELAMVAERRAHNRRRITQSVAAACVLIAGLTFALVSWHAPESPQRLACFAATAQPAELLGCDVLMTTATERRVVSLQDGSSVTLSGSTRIETEWLARERRVRLVSGRALFRVAKDKSRPFVVTAGDRRVIALGTAFDVRLDAQKIEVTLIEGRVAVQSVRHSADQPSLELTPDQQFVALSSGESSVRAVDSSQESAWAEGQIYFSDELLANAIAEMNQHSSVQIVIGDASLGDYRVNGMFRADNQDGFVSALTSYFPIDARTDETGRIVLRARTTN